MQCLLTALEPNNELDVPAELGDVLRSWKPTLPSNEAVIEICFTVSQIHVTHSWHVVIYFDTDTDTLIRPFITGTWFVANNRERDSDTYQKWLSTLVCPLLVPETDHKPVACTVMYHYQFVWFTGTGEVVNGFCLHCKSMKLKWGHLYIFRSKCNFYPKYRHIVCHFIVLTVTRSYFICHTIN